MNPDATPDLSDEWTAGAEALPIIDQASVSLAREQVRHEGAALGLPVPVIESLVIVASELAHNQLRHARMGVFLVRPVRRGDVPGLEIIAADRGAGLRDAQRALYGSDGGGGGSAAEGGEGEGREGRGAGSLGIGLSGTLRLADEVDLDVRLGEGTCVWARKFAAPTGPRREVAVLAQPHPDEHLCGDHAAFVRRDDGTLVLGVADGLGHGPQARQAACRAMAALRAAAAQPPSAVLQAVDRALGGTRGAVMAVAELDASSVSVACAGDVSAQLARRGAGQRFLCSARVLGMAPHAPRPAAFRPDGALVHSGDLVVLHTDGLLSRLAVPEDPVRWRQHPLLLCEHLLSHFARGYDDALILICRA